MEGKHPRTLRLAQTTTALCTNRYMYIQYVYYMYNVLCLETSSHLVILYSQQRPPWFAGLRTSWEPVGVQATKLNNLNRSLELLLRGFFSLQPSEDHLSRPCWFARRQFGRLCVEERKLIESRSRRRHISLFTPQEMNSEQNLFKRSVHQARASLSFFCTCHVVLRHWKSEALRKIDWEQVPRLDRNWIATCTPL